MMRDVKITQAMIDAAGDCVERAVRYDDIAGITFVQVAGGLWTLYNDPLRQAIKRRFQTVEQARNFAIERLVTRVEN